MMRQAGRYLPEYRAVRAQSDFLTMVRTPELAAEVTIQPVDLVGVDAAILFSDILVIPEAMGMHLIMEEARGPRFPMPIRSREQVDALPVVDPDRDLRYVTEAASLVKRQLQGRVPLIGFSGAPWTLAAYMVEGGGTKNFSVIKKMMLDEPETLMALLEKLSLSVRNYLEAQIAAGVDAVQIFDTWGGILAPDHFRKFSLEWIADIVGRMRRGGVPVIVFSKGIHGTLKDLATIGADVVGIDWTVDIGEARELVGDRVALQGNLDPAYLYASPERIRHEVSLILKKYGEGSGHIFNLGHGILPDVPPDHARAMVRAVQDLSPVFHKRG
jgi:uroporphyrinogen decarboxylase